MTLPELYIVRYNADPLAFPSENHKSSIIMLTVTDEHGFNNIDKAIEFLNECTDPITRIEDLIPELKRRPKFKWILPDSHIKIKHQAIGAKIDMMSEMVW